MPLIRLEEKKILTLSCVYTFPVSPVAQLTALAEVLNSCKEFGFDLEAHNARTYHGLSCLLQISTETQVQLASGGLTSLPVH